eukprot:TRINITY_DN12919_c0_g1_i1.p1 TRINITY_DN12919_c0_g1~~TRINITY_DN12919_c0_g1_i1.p1  ORF type:complete len:300 (+),score=52.57 TRINITY_DN12919_c0_g1_i1:48-902(+)
MEAALGSEEAPTPAADKGEDEKPKSEEETEKEETEKEKRIDPYPDIWYDTSWARARVQKEKSENIADASSEGYPSDGNAPSDVAAQQSASPDAKDAIPHSSSSQEGPQGAESTPDDDEVDAEIKKLEELFKQKYDLSVINEFNEHWEGVEDVAIASGQGRWKGPKFKHIGELLVHKPDSLEFESYMEHIFKEFDRLGGHKGNQKAPPFLHVGPVKDQTWRMRRKYKVGMKLWSTRQNFSTNSSQFSSDAHARAALQACDETDYSREEREFVPRQVDHRGVVPWA